MLAELKSSNYLIKLSVLAYENQNGSTYNEVNWLNCRAEFEWRGWACNYGFSCFTFEIADFHEQLKSLLGGTRQIAEFKPLEREVWLKFARNISAIEKATEVRFASKYLNGNSGSFHLDLNLEFNVTDDAIPKILTDVEAAVIKFPVIRR